MNPNKHSYNDYSNILKLSLRKPAKCNWELTTSKSSPNIFLPKIQLYDNKGRLLAQTNKADQVFKGGDNSTNENFNTKTKLRDDIINKNIYDRLSNSNNSSSIYNDNNSIKIDHSRSKSWQECVPMNYKKSERPARRTMSTNMSETNYVPGYDRRGNEYKSRRRSNTELNRLSNFDTLNRTLTDINFDNPKSPSRSRNISNEKIFEDVEMNYSKGRFNKIPVSEYGAGGLSQNRRGNSDNRLLECGIDQNTKNFSISKSKSALEIPKHNSLSSLKDRGRKEYHRVHSSNSLKFSSSILERKSATNCHSSSSESGDKKKSSKPKEDDDDDKPKYTLRTSKAGTIIVCEESFRNRRVRRRPRSTSRGRNEKTTDGAGVAGSIPTMNIKEKIKTEYEYIGKPHESRKSSLESTLDENLFKKSNETRYDTAIAGIDKLISRLSAQQQNKNNNSKRSNSFCDKIKKNDVKFINKDDNKNKYTGNDKCFEKNINSEKNSDKSSGVRKKLIKRRSVSAGSERNSSPSSSDADDLCNGKRHGRWGTRRKRDNFSSKHDGK